MASTVCCQNFVSLQAFGSSASIGKGSSSTPNSASPSAKSCFRHNAGLKSHPTQWQGLKSVPAPKKAASLRQQIGVSHAGASRVTAKIRTPPTVKPLGLEVEEEEMIGSRIKLTVKVPASLCKDTWERALRTISKEQKIKGFKAGGRVPDDILISHVGKRTVYAAVLDALLQKTMPEALSQVAGRALKDSEHITSTFDDMMEAFSTSKPFTYEVTVDVAPELQWASDRVYANMSLTVEVPDVTPEQLVEAELNSRLKDKGSLQVSDKPMKMGDVAIIDMTSKKLADDGTLGEVITATEQKGFQLDSDAGVKTLLPGFVEALLGMKRDDTREFDIVFPATWQQESLRGVKARFTVLCKELFIRVLPELDDSMAAKLLEGASTIAEVRETLLKQHAERVELQRRQAVHYAITDELARIVEVDVPNSLLEEQGRQMYAAKLIEFQVGRKLSVEQLQSLTSQEMVDNFLLGKKEEIRTRVKQTLAVAEIYKAEKLSFSEEELKAEMDIAMEEFKRYNQEYDKEKIREQAEELLEGAKVLEWLVEQTKVTFKPVAAEA